MKKAIRTILCLIGAMMVLSLAACTPTTDRNQAGSISGTAAAGGGQGTVPERGYDREDAKNQLISLYSVSADGAKLEGTMETIPEMTEQAIVDKLIEYGVLDEGTTVVSFSREGTPASKDVGPGIITETIPGMPETESPTKEYGVLELNQFPDDAFQEKKLQAVADTFIENFDVLYMTIQVDGEILAENLSFVEAGK
ncbi:MAG: hypothetical protein LUE65_05755 [Clostridiales bacterium]|nr:hypothetical protein [Clostridiales bacterium]